MRPGEDRGAPALGRRGAVSGARGVDRLPHRAHDETARMRGDERRDVGLREQRIDRGEAAAGVGATFGHGDLVVSRRAEPESRAAGFGVGTASTPCASAVAPLRFVAPRTRTRYLAPGASGVVVWTTMRSAGTGRCFKSWRMRAVSTGVAVVSRPAGAREGGVGRRGRLGGRAGGVGAPAGARRAVVSLRAVVSRARCSESAIAWAFARSES